MKLNLLAVKKNYAGHCDSCEQILALEGLRQTCKVEKAGLGYGKTKRQNSALTENTWC